MTNEDGIAGQEVSPKHSPLHERHRAAGAKWGDFGGFQMPLEYAGGGVVAEHTAVRQGVGVFDVSHLGKASVRGDGALEFVNRCLTADLSKVSVGQAQYTLCCDDASGGVADDMIAYVFGPDHVFLVPNAANTGAVAARLADAAPAGIEVVDEHLDHAVLAVQGPRSGDLLAALGLPHEHAYMSFVDTELTGVDGGPVRVVVARSGYTGELGYELITPADTASRVWDRLLEVGAKWEVRPCGLGARDTLRTEMGYPLHGQDLSLDITPLQGRSSWAVGWSKPEFWGREVLLAEKEAGPRRRLVGLRATGRGIPRPGMAVSGASVGDADGGSDGGVASIGVVTSGTFSPTLKTGIALALVDTAAGLANGDPVRVDIRGRLTDMIISAPPFVESHVK